MKPSAPGFSNEIVGRTRIDFTITAPTDYGGDRTLDYHVEWRFWTVTALLGSMAVPDISQTQMLTLTPYHNYNVTVIVSNDRFSNANFRKFVTLQAGMLADFLNDKNGLFDNFMRGEKSKPD